MKKIYTRWPIYLLCWVVFLVLSASVYTPWIKWVYGVLGFVFGVIWNESIREERRLNRVALVEHLVNKLRAGWIKL